MEKRIIILDETEGKSRKGMYLQSVASFFKIKYVTNFETLIKELEEGATQ